MVNGLQQEGAPELLLEDTKRCRKLQILRQHTHQPRGYCLGIGTLTNTTRLPAVACLWCNLATSHHYKPHDECLSSFEQLAHPVSGALAL